VVFLSKGLRDNTNKENINEHEIELLKNAINEIRSKLYQLLSKSKKYGINDEILRVSQELDQLINEYFYKQKDVERIRSSKG
jgi:hypothetical protein